jgi:hypothetical protein
MRTYKYKTKISNEGAIEVPISPDLYDKEVDLIIIAEGDNQRRKITGKEFVKKWSGFLKDADIENAKSEYLKHG